MVVVLLFWSSTLRPRPKGKARVGVSKTFVLIPTGVARLERWRRKCLFCCQLAKRVRINKTKSTIPRTSNSKPMDDGAGDGWWWRWLSMEIKENEPYASSWIRYSYHINRILMARSWWPTNRSPLAAGWPNGSAKHSPIWRHGMRVKLISLDWESDRFWWISKISNQTNSRPARCLLLVL